MAAHALAADATYESPVLTLDVALHRIAAENPSDLLSDVVLPVQLGTGVRQDSLISGPRALMFAVLADAIRCLLRGRSARRESTEARAWIVADDPSWPMSFRNVCDALGIVPGRLRAALLAQSAVQRSTQAADAAPVNPWRTTLRRSRPRSGVKPRRQRSVRVRAC